jgi:hypothetical protein
MMTRHARNLGEGGVIIGTARWIKSAARFSFWRCRSGAPLNRALIHLSPKLTWVFPRFSWESVVAGIDDAGP